MTFHLASSWARVVTGNICIFLMQCLFNKFLPPDTLRMGRLPEHQDRECWQLQTPGSAEQTGRGCLWGLGGKERTAHPITFFFSFFVYTISQRHLFNF